MYSGHHVSLRLTIGTREALNFLSRSLASAKYRRQFIGAFFCHCNKRFRFPLLSAIFFARDVKKGLLLFF